MAVLVDPPRWPAHGTTFGHLVSDRSLDELHAFARAVDLPPRAFDHDHYDVPARRYPDLLAAGAQPVASTELLRRLVAAGLRVRPLDRTPKPAAALAAVRAAWDDVLPGADGLRDDLLGRWTEPHRRYHDVRHLAQCLDALRRLAGGDAVARPVALAAWFHDAVYEGRAGADERASADLAERLLPRWVGRREASEVARLVLVTLQHAPEPGDPDAAVLVDADLSVLGQVAGRYHVYLRDVREEYARYTDEEFRQGRLAVVESLLGRDRLFHTRPGRGLWADRAAVNLAEEHARLSG